MVCVCAPALMLTRHFCIFDTNLSELLFLVRFLAYVFARCVALCVRCRVVVRCGACLDDDGVEMMAESEQPCAVAQFANIQDLVAVKWQPVVVMIINAIGHGLLTKVALADLIVQARISAASVRC